MLDGDFLIVTVDLARWRRLREGAEGGIFKSRLERWLYLITESEGIDPESPPSAVADPEFEEAIEIMRVFTQDEMERDRYLARLEYQQMVKDIRESDQAEGLAKGSSERARADARNFKRLGVDAGIIAEATGLPLDEIEGL